jgi:hypothetical protein
MNPLKTLVIVVTFAAAAIVPLDNAKAWVAAGGGYYHGGAYYHGAAYYHPPYYHPPAPCYGCGAAAGAVAGLAIGAMAGAAIANASKPAAVYVQPAPVIVQQPAYVVQGNVPIGTQLAYLPPGSNSMVVNGVNYYQSGPNWYKPYFGSSGVYYQVVPAP